MFHMEQYENEKVLSIRSAEISGFWFFRMFVKRDRTKNVSRGTMWIDLKLFGFYMKIADGLGVRKFEKLMRIWRIFRWNKVEMF